MTKAILLSAGRGERLRPITDTIPKSLIVAAGKPLIVHHLEKLAKAGITEIIINISYMAEKIKAALGNGKQFGVKITYSYEPTPLETGGGIYQALPLLGDEPFLAISSDIYTDYPLETLVKKCHKLAHLILAPNPEYNLKGDFSLDKNGLVFDKPEFTYASFAAIHPKLFQDCKPGKFQLAPILRTAMKHQNVTGEVYRGLWINVGSEKELKKLEGILR